MADNLPAIWERPPHTAAKHQILEAYLHAWMPIMSRQAHRVRGTDRDLLFVDGFAGPGCYSGGEDGSPILAIRSVLSHSQEFPVPISFLFVEEHPERYRILQQNIDALQDQIRRSPKIGSVTALPGDCECVLNDFLAERKQKQGQIGPALFYLDQFGYSDIPIELLGRIMSQSQCEVLSYLNWDHLQRFLSDGSKSSSITRAFGDDQWRYALGMEYHERASFILQNYRNALCSKGRSKYVWQFAMCDNADKLLYWLFFCTNNLRGLEEMKKAMWRVDPSGGFRFSDRDDPAQLHLFSGYSQEALAGDLASELAGRTLSIGEIQEYVLSETPEFRFKNSLKLLETTGRLQPVNPRPNRRKGTFPDMQMRVRFTGSSPR